MRRIPLLLEITGPTSEKAIKRKLHTSNERIYQALWRLESIGIIRKWRDIKNNKSYRYSLTAKGRRHCAALKNGDIRVGD